MIKAEYIDSYGNCISILEIRKIENQYWIDIDFKRDSGWSYFSYTSLNSFLLDYRYSNEIKKYVQKYIKNIAFV